MILNVIRQKELKFIRNASLQGVSGLFFFFNFDVFYLSLSQGTIPILSQFLSLLI